MDVKIFVDVDPDPRFIRRPRCNIAEQGRTPGSVIAPYLETMRPMHLEFVEPGANATQMGSSPKAGSTLVTIQPGD